MITDLNGMISEKVLEVLKARGLKHKPFAIRCGIDPALFRRLLKGTARWNTSHLEAVLNELGVSQEDFMYRMFRDEGANEPYNPQITPEDKWRFEKRIKMARVVRKKFPSFDKTTEDYFQVFLEAAPEVVHEMERSISFLARNTKGTFIERRQDYELRGLLNKIIDAWNQSDSKGKKALALVISLLGSVPLDKLSLYGGEKNGTTGQG
jgi:hypothetical protein